MRKNTMNSFVLGMVLTAMASNALAQTNVVGVGVTRNGGTGSILGSAGTYTVRTYDQTAIDNIFVTKYFERQDQDKAWLIQTQQDIASELKGLIDDLNKPSGLVDLSIRSSTTGGANALELPQYVGAQQEIVASVNRINSKIRGVMLLPSLMNSQQNLTVDGAEKMMPAPLKVQLEKLENFFLAQTQEILGQVSNSLFLVRMPNGAVQQIRGINFSLDSVPMNADVLTKMTRDVLANRAKVNDADLRNMVDELNRQTLAEIRKIRSAFGTEQIYRFNITADKREVNFERLAKIFLARDYLRYTYGVQLGAIGISYQTMFANMDVIFRSSKNILNLFSADFATDTPALIDFQKAIALAKFTTDKRVKEVFGEGVSILDRVMSGVEFVKGQTQLATVNAFVLALMDRDIAHELMLTETGGSRMVRQDFRAIYAATPAIEAKTRRDIADLQSLVNHETNPDDLDADIGAVQAGTFKGSVQIAIGGLDSMINYIEQANQMDAGLQKLRESCGVCNTVKKRSTF